MMCAIPKKSSSANKLEIRDLCCVEVTLREVQLIRLVSLKIKTDKKYRELAPARRDLGVVARVYFD